MGRRSYLQHGITVFIDVPVPVLGSRVLAMGTASRPLLAANGSAEQGEQGAQGGPPSGAAQQGTKLQEVRGGGRGSSCQLLGWMLATAPLRR